MSTSSALDITVIEQALAGQLEAPGVKGVIDALQSRLDDLLPVVNREFANAVTEAYDLTAGSTGMGLTEALRSIATLQAELDVILFPQVDAQSAGLDAISLPSPEMLFSDVDHVPQFVDWSRVNPSVNDLDLTMGWGEKSGISSGGTLSGSGLDLDRFDA